MNTNNLHHYGSNPAMSFFVMASAGTGKTKMLVDRIFRLLIHGIPLSGILCLTFTKAAAYEMRERVLDLLKRTLEMDDAVLAEFLAEFDEKTIQRQHFPFIRSLYFKVLEEQHLFKIQTIHSFCQSFLEKNSLLLDRMSPFEILDDVEKRKLVLKSISRVSVLEKYADDFLYLSNCMSLSSMEEKILMAVDFTTDQIKKSLSFNCLKSLDFSHDDIVLKIKKLPQEVLEKIDLDNIFSFFLTKTDEVKKRFLKKELLEKYSFIQDELLLIANLCAALKDFEKMQSFILLNKMFFKIILAVKNEYELIKKRLSFFDFNDLILQTISLLNHPQSGSIHQKIGESIQAVLIDEAQDTSPIQWEVIFCLIENMLLRDREQSSLFVVGDLKQSIYSFQGANPKIFLEKQKAIKKLFQQYQKPFDVFSLNRSYRCTSKVLDVVDCIFNHNNEGLFLTSRIQHDAHRTDEGFVGLVPVVKKKIELEDTSYNILAQTIAVTVEELVKQKGFEPKDIMILFRNRHAYLDKLYQELLLRDIPASGMDKICLQEHPFVKVFLSFLTWCLSKGDDYSLLQVLKSPFFGGDFLTEKELYYFVQKKGERSLWEVLTHSASDALQPEIFSFIVFAKKILSQIGYQSITTILNTVWAEKEHIFKSYYGIDIQEIYDLFYNTIYELENKRYLSLQETVWHLKTQFMDIKKDMGHVNQVKMMTVHGAKGLESPIVILADANFKATLQKETFMEYNDLYILKPSNDDCPLQLKEYKEKALKDLYHEDRRLLYVALTRARDCLLIFGEGEEVEGSWYHELSNHILELEDLPQKVKNISIVDEKTSKLDMPEYFLEEVDKTFFIQPEYVRNKTAIERGICIHKMLEVIPFLKKDDQKKYAENFLLGHSNIISDADMILFLRLINEDQYKKIFQAKGFSEITLSYEGNVYRIDRLIIDNQDLIVLDFKTGKKTHQKLMQYKKKMAIYRAAVQKHYSEYDIQICIFWIDEWILDFIKE